MRIVTRSKRSEQKLNSYLLVHLFLIFCTTASSIQAAHSAYGASDNQNPTVPLAVPLMVSVVPNNSTKRVIVPRDSIDISWYSDTGFDDSGWQEVTGDPGGVGFDNDGDYQKLISYDLRPSMYGRNMTCYIRIPFHIAEEVLRELDYLALKIYYDDGFVAYLNGRRVAEANAREIMTWRSGATQTHEASNVRTFEISQHLDVLNAGDNLLAIHGLNISGNSPDFLILAELVGRKNYYNNFVAQLPIAVVSTEGGVAIRESSRTTANLDIIHRGNGQSNRLSDPASHIGPIAITRNTNPFDYPKSSYSFTVTEADGQKRDAVLLDLPAGDEWVLYAPYSDKTLLRNALAATLYHEMGAIASQNRLCHLFLGEQYAGIYILMEAQNRHKNRIPISELSADASSGDEVTGGYIIKLGSSTEESGFVSPFPPFPGSEEQIDYIYDYPPADEITAAQEDYITNKINDYETVMERQDFDDPVNGYSQYIDVASFVDFFLINELTKNVHGYRSNTIIYKDRDSIDKTLSICPVWDFDHAFGNADFYEGWDKAGWMLTFLTEKNNIQDDSLQVPFWWRKLFESENFRSRIYDRWREQKQQLLAEEYLLDLSDSLYDLIESDRINNFERWPVIGTRIWPNEFVGTSYDHEFDQLFIWLADRIDWMDETIEALHTEVVAERPAIKPEGIVLYQNYPNPYSSSLSPGMVIRYQLPRDEYVSIKVYNLLGQEVAVLVQDRIKAGYHSIKWNGFLDGGRTIANGVYFYQMKAGDFTRTRKFLVFP